MGTRCNIVVIDVFGGDRTIESIFENTEIITLKEAGAIYESVILYIGGSGDPYLVGRTLLGLFCEKEVKNAPQAERVLRIHKEMYATIDLELYSTIDYLYIVTKNHIHFYDGFYENDIKKFKLLDSYETG